MADKLHIRQHTIGEDDDSDTDQPVRKRTKYPEGLEAFESNTKDPNNTTLKESLEAWVSLHATEASASISRFSIAYNNQSANYITPMEPPLIPDTVANEISDVYPMNVQRPTVKTVPSTLQYRIETNQQLVHFNKPILHGQSLESDAKGPLRLDDADEHTCINTNGREHNQQYFHWLVANAVEEFIKDEFKGPTVISEVVFLGPFLGRHTYRRLLSCLTSKFERDIMLDVAILQALVQLIEGAPPGHLEDDDLIRTLAVLRRQIQGTHNTSAELVYQITTAISRFLDVMVNGMANKVNSTVVHQHLVAALRELMGTKNPILMLQAQYGLQALKYIMNDEPILQVILRFDGGITRTALGVASTSKLDPSNFFNSLNTLRHAASQAFEVTMSVLKDMKSSQNFCFGVIQSLVRGIREGTNQEWYLTLLAAKTFIRQGRFSDFSQIVCKAYCRDKLSFQLGICQILGDIVMDSLWSLTIRQRAVNFLVNLFRDALTWKQHSEVKQWILVILTQLSGFQDAAIRDYAGIFLQGLIQEGAIATFATIIPYSLSIRLPLPESFPLRARVQRIPCLEYDVHKFRLRRLGDSRQRIYIPPMAKANLQSRDDDIFSLMDDVQEFLKSESEVMLILGDSGSGKSTFNLQLEYTLWASYKYGDPIPLHINLPSIDKPSQNIIGKRLRELDFSKEQIKELKQNRQFIVICDGYDESQLKSNIHSTNLFNRPGQWKVKMIVTCRTQYLGSDYRNRFAPQGSSAYSCTTLDLFQEAVIAPFTEEQIEEYVDIYVPLEPRTWSTKDYMDSLTTIPNLMDLVKNPFLLSLALEALPGVTKGKQDMSTIKITRVQLYDTFVQHWFEVNQRRLERNNDVLSSEDQHKLVELVEADFVSLGIDYSTRLAQAIFDKQDGSPVVHYVHFNDKNIWKAEFFGSMPEVRLLRDSSPLTRTGNYFRFIHRSMLEYFLSRIIYNLTKGDKDKECNPQAETTPTVSHLLHASNPLSQRNLLHEPSVIQFLSDRVNLNPAFNNQLRAVIELSKTDDSATVAATNAITILVRAGVPFNGEDLRGIKIPGADLSNGQFDSAQFQGADLKGVNFVKCWLRQADMSDAHMEGVRFGELPYLKMDSCVKSCAYSPNGKMLGAALEDGNTCIYDTSTWARKHYLKGHSHSVNSIVFSPDSQRLVSGSNDMTARLWDTASGENIVVMRGHNASVTCVTISPCGNRIASASYDWTVRLWNAQTGEMMSVMKGNMNPVRSVKYSPDGYKLIAVTQDVVISVWDLRTGEPKRILDIYEVRVCCIAYSPDGWRVATGHNSGRLQLRDALTLEPWSVLTGHTDDITAIDFSPDSQWMASSSIDKTVRLWDASTSTLVSILTGHCNAVHCVAFSPNGSEIASGDRDGILRLWEVDSKWSSLNPQNGRRMVTLAYSRDGQSIFSRDEDGVFDRWDTATGTSSPIPYEMPKGGIWSRAYAPDGSQLAFSRTPDGSICLWNCQSGMAGHVLEGGEGFYSLDSLSYSPSCRWLASIYSMGSVQLWDFHDVEPQPFLVDIGEGLIISKNAIVFSSTGCQFAIAILRGQEGRIFLFDTLSRECQSQLDLKRGIFSMVFSPNDQQIAVGTRGGIIYFWDLQSKEPSAVLEVDDESRNFGNIVYSPCGQWIATASEVRSVGIWHRRLSDGVESWSKVYSINAFFYDIETVACSPVPPMELVTSTQDGTVQLWRISIDEDGRIVFKMVWGSNLRALCAESITFRDAIGLSPIQQKLLAQRSVISPLYVDG